MAIVHCWCPLYTLPYTILHYRTLQSLKIALVGVLATLSTVYKTQHDRTYQVISYIALTYLDSGHMYLYHTREYQTTPSRAKLTSFLPHPPTAALAWYRHQISPNLSPELTRGLNFGRKSCPRKLGPLCSSLSNGLPI